jgi:hypothetical protein
MSTKGVSVTAARRLVDDVCGANDIPLLVLHDFDKVILDYWNFQTRHKAVHIQQ